MVTTQRADLAETLRRFRNHGISSEARERQSAGQWQYEMVMLGMNTGCRTSLRVGIEPDESGWTRNLARRREIAAAYSARLAGFPA